MKIVFQARGLFFSFWIDRSSFTKGSFRFCGRESERLWGVKKVNRYHGGWVFTDLIRGRQG
jgi:hypothetical protein